LVVRETVEVEVVPAEGAVWGVVVCVCADAMLAAKKITAKDSFFTAHLDLWGRLRHF
jgi:hypothetical protein